MINIMSNNPQKEQQSHVTKLLTTLPAVLGTISTQRWNLCRVSVDDRIASNLCEFGV